VTRDCVALHIANTALVLTFGACTIRSAGLRDHLPVTAERAEALVEDDFASLHVMGVYQCFGVVDQ
jgi:hypothetical protein